MSEATDPVLVAVREQVLAVQPAPRRGELEEVAGLVVFLASEEASLPTRSEFVVDGGAVTGQVHRAPVPSGRRVRAATLPAPAGGPRGDPGDAPIATSVTRWPGGGCDADAAMDPAELAGRVRCRHRHRRPGGMTSCWRTPAHPQ